MEINQLHALIQRNKGTCSPCLHCGFCDKPKSKKVTRFDGVEILNVLHNGDEMEIPASVEKQQTINQIDPVEKARLDMINSLLGLKTQEKRTVEDARQVYIYRMTHGGKDPKGGTI